ncbi:MAG: MBL fold metallo-hydrolase [Myxococcota bacterium]
MRIVGGIALVLALALLVGGWIAFGTYAPLAVDPAWEVAGDRDIPEGALTVRYTGCATLVFSDGETTWMTDGWFTRPGPLALGFGEIEPDLAAIDRGLARNEVTELAAVFPLHSHYDHAMDAPEVAERTGALLLGSESTANIGRGWGLDESQIRVVEDRVPVRIGRFVVTPIESKHFAFPDPAFAESALADPTIAEPLVPPAGAFAYKVGKAYVLHVAHPKGSFAIVGSAGYVKGGLEGYDADVVFLGIGALGSQTDEYREAYWHETVDRIGATRVVPIHWDGLTNPIEGPFQGSVRVLTLVAAGGDDLLRDFLEAKRAATPERAFFTLPRYDPVVLF